MSGIDKDFMVFTCIIAFNAMFPTTPAVAMIVTIVLFYFLLLKKEK